MMTRLIALVPILAATAAAAQQPAPAVPMFSAAASDLVVLPVAVVHGDGHFVAGLDRDRFAVFDNGQRQPIALFSSADAPVTLGLVIDDSGSMGPKLGEVVAAALALARSSNPDDQVFAIAFNDGVRPVMAGRSIAAQDTGALDAALSGLVPEGRTALYDATLAALDRETASTGTARQVIVLISDGGDNASRAGLDEVATRARQASTTIYTIGLFDPDDPDTNPRVLKQLAAETGGERFLPRSPSELLRDIAHIAREVRDTYTLGYVPPARDGRYHRIRVTVDVPGAKHLSVRTRPGYVAPAPAPHGRS